MLTETESVTHLYTQEEIKEGKVKDETEDWNEIST